MSDYISVNEPEFNDIARAMIACGRYEFEKGPDNIRWIKHSSGAVMGWSKIIPDWPVRTFKLSPAVVERWRRAQERPAAA